MADSWDAEEDSEAEAEKARVAAERKAKAEAEAAANKKSKSQRLAQHQAARKAQKEAEEEETSSEEDDDDDEEDETEKRERLRKTEQDADLKHAQDLLGDVGISNQRSTAPKTVVVLGGAPDSKSAEPSAAVDLSSLALFRPKSKDEFEKMSQVLVPLIAQNARHPQYSLSFLPEFVRAVARELPSAEIKKLSSALALLLNEKLKEEKAADKGGKKTKAAKTKTSLVANRDTVHKADTTVYDDGMDESVSPRLFASLLFLCPRCSC